MSLERDVDCVILGAGVLGLSIALELVSSGLHPVILARDLPEDIDSKEFASPWAGANWSSSASTKKERDRDRVTFKRFEKMAAEVPDLVRLTPFVFFSTNEIYDPPWYRDLVHGYTDLPPERLPSSYRSGVTYKSFTINAPRYLAHLAKRLRDSKVDIKQRILGSIDDVLSEYSDVDLLINASGLGSKSLQGVRDEQMYSGRGQTVLIRAPHIKACYCHRLDWTTNTRRYIIPRPGPEVEVILGGTFDPDESATEPDLKVAERIMRDACKMCPDLGNWDELTVISHQVGLRPMRKGGMRVEHERRKRSQLLDNKDREYDCIHAYGIGSGGYQGSWGVAQEVAGLVQKCRKGRTLSEDLSSGLGDQPANIQLS